MSFVLALLILHPEKVRQCKPAWPTATDAKERGLRIAIVTMPDSRLNRVTDELAVLLGLPKGTPPMDVLTMTWPHKARYAARHGYALFNGSDLIDTTRPPSWSKLLVVMSRVARYDWVFYLDADTYITNEDVRLEDLLPWSGGPDLVLTGDTAGVNAGAWMVRNSDWSWAFLRQWWGSEAFIRRGTGDTKSGDNDALRALLESMAPEVAARHVGIAPQCAFNSYIWRTSLRQLARLLLHPAKVLQGIWHPGDFVLHLAGFRNKGAALQGVAAALLAHERQRPHAPRKRLAAAPGAPWGPRHRWSHWLRQLRLLLRRETRLAARRR